MPRLAKKNEPWRPPSNHAVSLCKTCSHPKRAEIEKGFALATHNSVHFQKQYGISWSNARNHYLRHVAPEQRAIIFADGRTANAIAKVEDEKIDVIETLKRLGAEADPSCNVRRIVTISGAALPSSANCASRWRWPPPSWPSRPARTTS